MGKPHIVPDVMLICGECKEGYQTYRFTTEDQTACPPCLKRLKRTRQGQGRYEFIVNHQEFTRRTAR